MRLSRELTTYVHNQTAQGVMPTDPMLQAEARRIMYGDYDDAGNQTCADNPLWLTIFKRDTGLETPANIGDMQLSDLGLEPPFAAYGGLRDPPRETNILAPGFGVGALPSLSVLSPRLRSPTYLLTGFSSATPSGQESLAESYTGSSGMISAGVPAFVSDWSSSLPGYASLSSVHAEEGPPDPLVQMGFDPEFLHRLSDRYNELTPRDMETVPFDASMDYEGGKGKQPWMNPVSQTPPLMGVPASDPLAAIYPKEGFSPASDAARSGLLLFHDDSEKI